MSSVISGRIKVRASKMLGVKWRSAKMKEKNKRKRKRKNCRQDGNERRGVWRIITGKGKGTHSGAFRGKMVEKGEVER